MTAGVTGELFEITTALSLDDAGFGVELYEPADEIVCCLIVKPMTTPPQVPLSKSAPSG
jgi:hypothetical protein